MLLAVLHRTKELLLAMLTDVASVVVDRDELVDALVATVRTSLDENRNRQLAMMALFLESSHRPSLRDELALVARALRETLESLCAKAGVSLTESDAWALLSFFNGSVFIGLTLPQLAQPTEDTLRAGLTALLGPYDGSTGRG
jgi:AcrR family transcriptional regulator